MRIVELSIVRAIAIMHGGEVFAQNADGITRADATA